MKAKTKTKKVVVSAKKKVVQAPKKVEKKVVLTVPKHKKVQTAGGWMRDHGKKK